VTAIAHRPGATRGTVYAYSPYGETTVLGPDEGNPLQYTGRENDGTELYYYRARYYDPGLKRFVSEDPIGLAGGINLLAYVDGNPISFADAFGLASPGSGLSWFWKLIGPIGGEAGTGAEAGISGMSGAKGASTGVGIGIQLCQSGVSYHGVDQDCNTRCIESLSVGSLGSDEYVECAKACTTTYNKCKKKPPQSQCPPPILS
jgi:RHS repeat-associated protein